MVAFIYTFICSLEIAGYTGHKVDELFHFHMLHMHQCSLWQCPKYLKNKSVWVTELHKMSIKMYTETCFSKQQAMI